MKRPRIPSGNMRYNQRKKGAFGAPFSKIIA